MSTDIVVRIDEQGRLSPTAQIFADDLQGLPKGKDLMCRIWSARNPKQTAWFHAMLDEVIKAGYWDGDRDSLKRFAKFSTGRYEEIIEKHSGKVLLVLDSVAESAMDGDTFNKFVRDVERVFAEKLSVDITAVRDLAKGSSGTDYTPREKKAAGDDQSPPAQVAGFASAGGEGPPSVSSPPATSSDDVGGVLHAFGCCVADAKSPRDAYKAAEGFWRSNTKPPRGTPARDALRDIYAAAVNRVIGQITPDEFMARLRDLIRDAL